MKQAQKGKDVKRQQTISDCIALTLRGKSYRQIGKLLGISHSTVGNHVQAYLKDAIEQNTHNREELRQLELERLNKALDDLETFAINYPHKADSVADKMVKISKARRELLGLDAPTKIAPTSPDGNKPYEPMVQFYIPSNGRDGQSDGG